MANTFKNSVSGPIGVTITTVYTVPASTTTVVIGFKIANVLSTVITVDIEMSGKEVGTAMQIPVGGVLEYLSGAKDVLLTTETVKVTCDTAVGANVKLSYMEIT